MKNIFIPIFFLFVIGLFSCNSENRIHEDDIEEIEAYLEDNNIAALRTDNDLFYVVEEEGNGQFPTLSDFVTVDYHGYYTDGQVFDSSVDRGMPVGFPLSGVIQGWQEGIPLFSKGGKGKLFIPSNLAYGQAGRGSIPPNAVLVFDVELIDF